jgi:hypothetical protein
MGTVRVVVLESKVKLLSPPKLPASLNCTLSNGAAGDVGLVVLKQFPTKEL